MFIVLEGGEGTGKSTQAKALAGRLEAQGHDVVRTREPGGSDLAETLRTLLVQGDPDSLDPETELLLFTAARRDHVRKVIRPAIERGAIVICDRFVGSTLAMQGLKICEERIFELHAASVGLWPDRTILLDIDVETGLERTRARARIDAESATESRFELKERIYHEKVRARFLELSRRLNGWRVFSAISPEDELADMIHDDIDGLLQGSDTACQRQGTS